MRVSAEIEHLQAEIKRLRKLGSTKREPIKGIGGEIQRLREKAGLGVREMAKRCMVSAGQITRLESDPKCNPCLTTLRAIAKGLRIKTSTLIQAEE